MSRLYSRGLLLLSGWIVMTTMIQHPKYIVIAFSTATSTTKTTTSIDGIPVHKVPLWRPNVNEDPLDKTPAPYCLVASMPPTSNQINFLATQVWPAARKAATILYQHIDPEWTVCEWGCGPGLPSLTAATRGCPRVIATDVDAFGVQLVDAAAASQDLQHVVETLIFDLVQSPTSDPKISLPQADLYVLSDVFESTAVARGSARWTQQALHQENGARVWVFCQSDRVQREAFAQELQNLLQGEEEYTSSLKWVDPDKVDPCLEPGTLWLCNVDETKVSYG